MEAVSATLLSKKILEGINSASALELCNGKAFVVADDAVFLYILDEKTLTIQDKVQIIEAPAGVTDLEGVPKKVKPDFELMTPIPAGSHPSITTSHLLALGSGSKVPSRDQAVLIKAEAPYTHSKHALTPLYDVLRADKAVTGEAKLNLEGATVAKVAWEASAAPEDCLLLFHRGNIGGVNSVSYLKLSAFLSWMLDNGCSPAAVPEYKVKAFPLPRLQGYGSGFSSAGTVDVPLPGGGSRQLICFSATVEGTLNEIDDGESMGSYVGVLDMQTGECTCTLVMEEGGAAATAAAESGAAAGGAGSVAGAAAAGGMTAYTGKIEGSAVRSVELKEQDGKHSLHFHIAAVTDMDGSSSEHADLQFTVALTA